MRSPKVRHPSRAPDVEALLSVLDRYGVEYVVVGSVAAAFYGVELTPGDLDIVPATGPTNLERVVRTCQDLEAQPLGPFGDWTTLESGERKWIPRPTTMEELADWQPDATDVSTLDHLFVTRLGNFDVVPEIAGTFDALIARARRHTWQGLTPWVAHVDDLLARLTIPRREKDAPRVSALRRIQRRLDLERKDPPSPPGSDPGSDPGLDLGSDLGSDPSDPGYDRSPDPGSDPSSGSGSGPANRP